MSLTKFTTREGKGNRLTMMVSEWNAIKKAEGFDKDREDFFTKWDTTREEFFGEIEDRCDVDIATYLI